MLRPVLVLQPLFFLKLLGLLECPVGLVYFLLRLIMILLQLLEPKVHGVESLLMILKMLLRSEHKLTTLIRVRVWSHLE